jgi:hypothetical protein
MSTIRQRRRGDRVLGTWDGRFRAYPKGTWGACTIVDLSPGGAGILVPPGSTVPDVWVDVDVHTVLGRRRPFVVMGAVRDAHTLPDGWQRLAIQFVALARRRERRLERLLARWR